MKLATRKTRAYSQTARAAAAEATAQRIVDAFLPRLLTQWFDEITLESVAADAQVTVQTVIRRFGGKEGLLAAAFPVLGAQIIARRDAPAGDIARNIRQLVADYEETGDAVLRLLALEARHPALKRYLDYGRSEHRRCTERAFGPLLEGRKPARNGNGVEGTDCVIDMLVVATDVYTWKLLRRDMGKSVSETAAIMEQFVRSLLNCKAE